MNEIRLPLPAEVDEAGLVAYLNEHIDQVRRSFDLDVSWAYIRATVDEVRITGATRIDDRLRIEYEYDYTAYCACKNLDAHDTLTDRTTCALREGNIVLTEYVRPERSTLEEF